MSLLGAGGTSQEALLVATPAGGEALCPPYPLLVLKHPSEELISQPRISCMVSSQLGYR